MLTQNLRDGRAQCIGRFDDAPLLLDRPAPASQPDQGTPGNRFASAHANAYQHGPFGP